jgi:hypothetical protein
MRCLRAVCVFACCVMPGFGTIITGVFVPPSGDLGVSNTYSNATFSGWSIVAKAFSPGCTSSCPDLFGKAGGAGETGVGLTNDPTGEEETTPGSFIELDLIIFKTSDPSIKLSPSSVLAITMNSTTGGEAFKISQSGTSGVFGTTCSVSTPCWTGTSNGSVTISPTLRFLDITSTAGNVLLSSITFDDGGGGGQAAPEPLSLGLTGLGLVAIYFARRRRGGGHTR